MATMPQPDGINLNQTWLAPVDRHTSHRNEDSTAIRSYLSHLYVRVQVTSVLVLTLTLGNSTPGPSSYTLVNGHPRGTSMALLRCSAFWGQSVRITG